MDYVKALKNQAAELAMRDEHDAAVVIFHAAQRLEQYQAYVQQLQSRIDEMNQYIREKEDVREERE